MTPTERRYYRDCFRHARYAALANSEGFQDICYAIEELGVKLAGEQLTMDGYKRYVAKVTSSASQLHDQLPTYFSSFEALYMIVNRARNDAMHTGAYARRATEKALELCLLIEDGLMNGGVAAMRRVGDYMVRDPVSVESWTPVAKARQLMLLHSFSNIPVQLDGRWHLVTELGVARFLREERRDRLGMTVLDATAKGLTLPKATCLTVGEDADVVLEQPSGSALSSNLWLVVDSHQKLLGVLTPFELM